MKKLLILIILLCSSVCYAMPPAIIGGCGGSSAAGCTDANPVGNCTGFLLCQNFETTAEACDPCTEDNSESWDKTLSGDAAITVDSVAGPLRGVQSLLLSRGTGIASITSSHTASADVYGFARLSLADGRPATGESVITLRDGGTARGYIYLGTGGKIRIYHGTAYKETAALLPDGATGTFYLWWYYTQGTGADGTYGLAYATTLTFPGWTVTDTNGTSTTTVSNILIKDQYTNGVEVDQVLVKATAIGNVCE